MHLAVVCPMWYFNLGMLHPVPIACMMCMEGLEDRDGLLRGQQWWARKDLEGFHPVEE